MTIMSQNSSLANRYVVVVIGVIITAVIVSSYLLFVSDTPSITKATVQVFTWILHPELHGELFSAANYAVLVGLLSFDFLLGLSVILAILPKEFQDNHLMVIPSSMLLGLALIGVFSILSVQFNNLTRESILSLAAAAIVVSNYISNRQKGQHVMTFLQEFFSSNFRKPAAFKVNSFSVKLLFVPIIIVIYAMIFFQATSFPITEWDAIVYHANVAKIWYENAPNYKVIAGPSVGIQMSYQYPPLFPAIGAAHYIIAGEFNDLYLRIEAPFLSLLTALMIYWIARKYFNEVPVLTVAFLLSMPLFVMYSIWPTNYSTLMALSTASIVFLILSLKTRSTRHSILTGLFIGLSALSSYYGIILATFAAIIVVAYLIRNAKAITQDAHSHKSFNILSALVANLKTIVFPLFLTLFFTASIWYIFNILVVGDPVFPLGNRFFDTKFVESDVLQQSLDQIKQNALGYWGESSKAELPLKQLYSISFDPQIYSLSILPALAGFGFAIWRRNFAMMIFGIWILVVVISQLAQGWFWLRTFTMILPAVAVLSAYAVDAMLITMKKANWKMPKIASKYSISAIVLAALIYPSFVISMVGINHPTMVYGIPTEMPYDYMYSWKNIGDQEKTLAGTFVGEADAWEWMNENVPAGSKVATLDAREYYLRSDMIFYLDGKEAAPLLTLDDPHEIRNFLVENGVRYIWAPGSSFRTASAYPIIDKMPIFKYLGTKEFPIIKLHDAWVPPSMLYDVYPADQDLKVTTAIFGTTKQNGYEIVNANNVRGGTLFVQTPEAGVYQVSILFRDHGEEKVDFNLQQTSGKWNIGYSNLLRTGSNTIKVHTFFVNAEAAAISIVGIYSYNDDFEIQKIEVSKVAESKTSVSWSEGIIGDDDSIIISPNDLAARLFVATVDARLYDIEITYKDVSTGSVDFNLQNADGTWQNGYSTIKRYDSGEIKNHIFRLNGRPGTVIPIGIFSYDESLSIYKVSARPAIDVDPAIKLSGVAIDNEDRVVKANDADTRLLIDAPIRDHAYHVEITYKDVSTGSVDFNLQNADGTWQNGYSTLRMSNSGATAIHIFPIMGRENSAIIMNLAASNDFLISSIKIADVSKSVDYVGLSGIQKDNENVIVKDGDLNARLFLKTLTNETYAIKITYKDLGYSTVDLNLQNADGTWVDGYSALKMTNSNETKTYSLLVDGRENSIITMGLYSRNSDLRILNLTINKATTSETITSPEPEEPIIVQEPEEPIIVQAPKLININQELAAGSYVLAAQNDKARMFVETKDNSLYAMNIVYQDTGTGNIDFNLQNADDTWQTPYSSISRSNSNATRTHTIYFDGRANSTITIGVYVHVSGFEIKSTESYRVDKPLIINTPIDGLYRLNVIYNDTGTGNIDFNLQNADDTWQTPYSSISRSNSNATRTHTIYFDGRANSTITMAIHPYDDDMSINVTPVDPETPFAELSNTLVEGTFYVISPKDIKNRMHIHTVHEGQYVVSMVYKDDDMGVIDLNLQKDDGTWQGSYSTIRLANTNELKFHTFLLDVKAHTTTTIGMYSNESKLAIKSINVDYIDPTKPFAFLSSMPLQGDHYVAKKGDGSARINVILPDEHYYRVVIKVAYETGGLVDYNIQREDGNWYTAHEIEYNDGPNKQRYYIFSIYGKPHTIIPIGVNVYGNNIEIIDVQMASYWYPIYEELPN